MLLIQSVVESNVCSADSEKDFFPMPDYEITNDTVKATITGEILRYGICEDISSQPKPYVI